MTQDYAIWKPEHDGHAPPNWREGMGCWHFDRRIPSLAETVSKPQWFAVDTYAVPAEALNSPNDDAPEVENGLPPLAKLVGWLGDYTTEELAKRGITLAPEKDWATELWADLKRAEWSVAVDDPNGGRTITLNEREAADKAAIDLMRARVEQMIAERSKRDAKAFQQEQSND